MSAAAALCMAMDPMVVHFLVGEMGADCDSTRLSSNI